MAVLLLLLGAGIARFWRPAQPMRVGALTAVERALGTSVQVRHVEVAPGEWVLLAWAQIGSETAPLEPGPSPDPPPPEEIRLRHTDVWLPGGIRLADAHGTLRRTRTGAQADLTGTASVAGVTAEGCRIQLVDGGRRIRVHSGLCYLAPRGIELSAIGLDARLRRDGTAGPWRGTVTSTGVICAGVPGRELTAGLTIDPSGDWSALPIRTGLADGIVRGHAGYRGGVLKFSAKIDADERPMRLHWVPPPKIGATTPLQGAVAGLAEAEISGDAIQGRVVLEGRRITLADLPALLSLTQTIQFRMRQDIEFERGHLEATLSDTGLTLRTLSLEGPRLTITNRGRDSDFIGWDGFLALQLRATAPQGLLGGMPLVGNVLEAIRPGTPEAVATHVDLNVGGSLSEPEAELPDDG